MKLKKFFPFLVGFGILAFGVVTFAILVALKSDVPKEEIVKRVPIVKAVNPEVRSGNIFIHGNGTVRPTREINLSSEVAGKITGVSASFVNGGRFYTGQTLVSIDKADYSNAVTIARATVTQREYELLIAGEENEIATREWEMLQKRTGNREELPASELGSLVLKEPQLKLAAAALESARAQLSDRELRLERTRSEEHTSELQSH